MNGSGEAFENIWFAGEVTREISIRGSRHLASKMYYNDPKHFYVTLFSNASTSLYPANTIGTFTVEVPWTVELGPKGKWEVGLCETSYPPNQVGTLKSVNVVGDTRVLANSDVISPQYVGRLLVRCLSTFICPTLHGEHIYDNIYYLPVEKRTIKNIRIEILQLTVKRVEFKSNKTPTKIVLRFRRVSAW